MKKKGLYVLLKPSSLELALSAPGTVLKNEKDHNVYYFTTAASILFAAGIGITVV